GAAAAGGMRPARAAAGAAALRLQHVSARRGQLRQRTARSERSGTGRAGVTATPLIIPCETLAREFDGKLLLACIAAKRGFRVILGGKPAIQSRLTALPRAIYMSNNLRLSSRRVLAILDRLG